jgi:spermidine synthase
MPSFLSVWSFLIANDLDRIANRKTDAIDETLLHRGINRKLRYYDGETHRHMFSLSKDFRELLSGYDARK